MSYLTDLAERTIATYVEAFLGLWIASAATDLLNLDVVQAAAVAAVPAALAVVKAGVARLVGDPASASLAPTVATPTPRRGAPGPSGVLQPEDPPQDDVPQDSGDHSSGPRVDQP